MSFQNIGDIWCLPFFLIIRYLTSFFFNPVAGALTDIENALTLITEAQDFTTFANSDPGIRYTGLASINMTSEPQLVGKFHSFCEIYSNCDVTGVFMGTNAALMYISPMLWQYYDDTTNNLTLAYNLHLDASYDAVIVNIAFIVSPINELDALT